jgi:hypothetical protein
MRDLVRRPSGLPDLSNGSSSSCLKPLLKSGVWQSSQTILSWVVYR